MDLSDVIFNVCDRQFTAHKIILAMKSPVFKAMFHHSSNKEVLSGQVKVEDIEPDVFQEILLFIYTGRTQLTAMNQMAPGILAAAEWGQIPARRLEDSLWNSFDSSNVSWDLLGTAVPHQHPWFLKKLIDWLKKFGIEYFRRLAANFRVKLP